MRGAGYVGRSGCDPGLAKTQSSGLFAPYKRPVAKHSAARLFDANKGSRFRYTGELRPGKGARPSGSLDRNDATVLVRLWNRSWLTQYRFQDESREVRSLKYRGRYALAAAERIGV